jgi:hypothetical protein
MVFAGRVPGLIPCLLSTFIVIDLLVRTEKRMPSMNSDYWLRELGLASCIGRRMFRSDSCDLATVVGHSG